jgi:hypothetical protein
MPLGYFKDGSRTKEIASALISVFQNSPHYWYFNSASSSAAGPRMKRANPPPWLCTSLAYIAILFLHVLWALCRSSIANGLKTTHKEKGVAVFARFCLWQCYMDSSKRCVNVRPAECQPHLLLVH